jgi:hypothetical protein
VITVNVLDEDSASEPLIFDPRRHTREVFDQWLLIASVSP